MGNRLLGYLSAMNDLNKAYTLNRELPIPGALSDICRKAIAQPAFKQLLSSYRS